MQRVSVLAYTHAKTQGPVGICIQCSYLPSEYPFYVDVATASRPFQPVPLYHCVCLCTLITSNMVLRRTPTPEFFHIRTHVRAPRYTQVGTVIHRTYRNPIDFTGARAPISSIPLPRNQISTFHRKGGKQSLSSLHRFFLASRIASLYSALLDRLRRYRDTLDQLDRKR